MTDEKSGLTGSATISLWRPTSRGLILHEFQIVKNLITDVGDFMYANRAIPILGSAVSISAITNNANAVVTTSTAHGYSVGDVVTIAGVTPTGYNGSWAVTAVGSTTTFTIYVGTALGAGTVFGTATSVAAPEPLGMKLGTGTTAVAKNGAGAALVTYLSGSNLVFDAGFPVANNLGAGLGCTTEYKVTWPAGTATNSAITEAVIFTDANANATSTAANTISRIKFTAVNKTASDILVVDWSHKFLGA